jgi:hypothetical protein
VYVHTGFLCEVNNANITQSSYMTTAMRLHANALHDVQIEVVYQYIQRSATGGVVKRAFNVRATFPRTCILEKFLPAAK